MIEIRNEMKWKYLLFYFFDAVILELFPFIIIRSEHCFNNCSGMFFFYTCRLEPEAGAAAINQAHKCHSWTAVAPAVEQIRALTYTQLPHRTWLCRGTNDRTESSQGCGKKRALSMERKGPSIVPYVLYKPQSWTKDRLPLRDWKKRLFLFLFFSSFSSLLFFDK